jgi:hypothetical protein
MGERADVEIEVAGQVEAPLRIRAHDDLRENGGHRGQSPSSDRARSFGPPPTIEALRTT